MSGNGDGGRFRPAKTLTAAPPALLGTLLYLDDRPLDTVHGELRAHRFENLSSRAPLVALTAGDVRSPEPLLVRIHSSCVTSEGYGGRDCDCVEQLDAAIAEIAGAGRGVLLYLSQEGRGAGLAAKARDRMIVQASGHRLTTFEAYERMGLERDHRRYDEVSFVCRLLGIGAPLVLLTNNPEKASAIVAAGATIASTRPLQSTATPFNLRYMTSKSRSGHDLRDEGTASAADPPESVQEFEPYVASAGRFVHLASYFLPVGLDRAAPDRPDERVFWFRVHAYFDIVDRCQRIVLTHGPIERVTPLVVIHEEELWDRFPLRRPSPSRRRWRASLERIVRQGAGAAVFVNADGAAGNAARNPELVALLARHLPGRRAHPVIDRRSSGAAFCDALLHHDIAIEKRVLLDEA